MTKLLTPDERKLELLKRTIVAEGWDQARIIRDILLPKEEFRDRVTELCKVIPTKKPYKQ